MIASDHTLMAQEALNQATQTIATVRPMSFMIDLERDIAEVTVTSSVLGMAWLLSFEISPAPASPDDWNAKISEAYNRLLLQERSVASEGATRFDKFSVGAGSDRPSSVRLMDSATQGISGADALKHLLELFVGADISELLLG